MIILVERWVDHLEIINGSYDVDLQYQYDEHFGTLRLILQKVTERKDVSKSETALKEAVDNSDEDKAKVG